jgi:hypothetical protein
MYPTYWIANTRNPSGIARDKLLLPTRYTMGDPEIEICTSTTLAQTATVPLASPGPSSAEVSNVLGHLPVLSWRKKTCYFRNHTKSRKKHA